MNETTVINKTERGDSLEFGSPSKTGVFKVYVDASDKEKAKQIIDNMVELWQHAKKQFDAYKQ